MIDLYRYSSKEERPFHKGKVEISEFSSGTMKTCTICNKTKTLSEFRARNKAKGTYSSWCRNCFSEYERNKYKNDPSFREKHYIQNQKRIERNYRYILDYKKRNPCPCGEGDPIVLQFDHIDISNKENNISDMCKAGRSIKSLEREISKCQVLCANCHLRRTAKQFNWFKYL